MLQYSLKRSVHFQTSRVGKVIRLCFYFETIMFSWLLFYTMLYYYYLTVFDEMNLLHKQNFKVYLKVCIKLSPTAS